MSVLHPFPWTKNLAQKFKILPTSLLQFFLLTKEKVGRGILSRRFENLVNKVKILPTLLLQFCFLINRGCKSSKFCIYPFTKNLEQKFKILPMSLLQFGLLIKRRCKRKYVSWNFVREVPALTLTLLKRKTTEEKTFSLVSLKQTGKLKVFFSRANFSEALGFSFFDFRYLYHKAHYLKWAAHQILRQVNVTPRGNKCLLLAV